MNFVARCAKRLFPPAHDKHPRAQLGEPQRHGPPEPRPAPGKKNRPTFQQIFLKHGFTIPPELRACVIYGKRNSIPEQNDATMFLKCIA
jgi:hypothetical protein